MKQVELIKKKLLSANNYLRTFLKWVVIAGTTGGLGGVIGSVFHKSVEYATAFREGHDFMILLLPLGGVIIVFLYRAFKLSRHPGTNHIIKSVRSDVEIPVFLAPLIFVSTVITHLLGGSAGREGAALQLGGSIGSAVGRVFRLDEKDMHLVVMCGMSGVFAALFGTPLTATLFAMEVISVGVMYYSGLVPCILSSFVAYGISLLFGSEPVRFALSAVPAVSVLSMVQVVGLSALCALVSIFFCAAMKYSRKGLKRLFRNDYVRAAAGGGVLVLATFALGTRDYNGAGMAVIETAMAGQAVPYAFFIKILFTAVTIAVGFKGGEIVPTFFVGATFGCFMGSLLGLDGGFGAAVGLVALFCGVANCPVASIILSIELFGAQGLLLFAAAVGVSYMLSGYYGVFSSQKIVYSKLRAEFINIHAK